MHTHARYPGSDGEAVRGAIAAAGRRRRAREAGRRLWQTAPAIAATALGTAAIARWAAWPALVPVLVLGVGGLALAIHVLLSRRTPPVDDALASRIDDEAGLGGELRSASWFAARESRDEWADFHLALAAKRLSETDWASLYPPVRAPRARLATAILTAGAIALSMTIPEPVRGAHAGPVTRGGAITAPGEPVLLPPELQRLLQELLAAAEAGNPAAVQALSSDTTLRDMLNRLALAGDRQLLDALARSLAAAADPQDPSGMDMLAERARRAAEAAGMSASMREALEQLADDLELAAPERRAAGDASDGDPSSQMGGGAHAGGGGDQEQLSIQFAEDAAAEGGGVVMMSSQDAGQGGGAPGGGFGGSGSPDSGGTTAAIEAALRQEMVEASQDAGGGNVRTEVRRRTEQGDATVGFTRGTAAAFDRVPGGTPPPVPETRRSGVQTYFVRTPR